MSGTVKKKKKQVLGYREKTIAFKAHFENI